jgi:energy-coupling factor transporter ATP-binding protein EcfA2
MPEYREIIASQSGQMVTRFLASRIRQPKQVDTASLPEPDRPALRAAEQLVATGRAPVDQPAGAVELVQGPLMFPDGLFDSVYDRDEAKLMLQRAIESPRPVHVLLIGDPASGKSQLLQCCAQLPASRYAVGGMTTSAGLVDYLLERPSTQLVIVDELDKASTGDFAAFYELMETGQVPRLIHGKTEILRYRGRVFAACNSAENLPTALRSRFVEVNLPPYTAEQVETITGKLLVREGLPAARAHEIAALTAERSSDPRDGIQIGRLAGKDHDLAPIAEQVIPKTRESR